MNFDSNLPVDFEADEGSHRSIGEGVSPVTIGCTGCLESVSRWIVARIRGGLHKGVGFVSGDL